METCRACLCKDSHVLNIHKSGCDVVYKECTSLEINIGDDLPHGICLQCSHVLNNFYYFKLQCNKSDNVLKKRCQIKAEYIKCEQQDNSLEIDNVENVDKKDNEKELNDHVDIEDVKIEYDNASIDSYISQISNKEFDSKQFKCTLCSKIFITKKKLDRHMKVHQDISDFLCTICNKTYKSRQYLKKHMLMHDVNADKIYKCIHCTKSFHFKFKLNHHMDVHKEFADIKCKVCDKAYRSRRYFKNHLLTHNVDENGEKAFKCDHCLKSFNFKYKLAYHMRVHMRVNLQCKICNKKFHTNCKLNKHVMMHKFI